MVCFLGSAATQSLFLNFKKYNVFVISLVEHLVGHYLRILIYKDIYNYEFILFVGEKKKYEKFKSLWYNTRGKNSLLHLNELP